MDPESYLPSRLAKSDCRIGPLGVFAAPSLESAYRRQHFRDDLWLCRFLVIAGMSRVALFLMADYHQFGVGTTFWQLLTVRALFLLVSVRVLVALPRTTSPAAADRLFFTWGLLFVSVTAYLISVRPPAHHEMLRLSFAVILVAYCITPIPPARQAAATLFYSIIIFCACRHFDGVTLTTVAVVYAMCHLFGVVTSLRLNHRRRETFLGTLREAELKAHLEVTLAEVRTLRGLLCICAWCKRIRAEEAWESVEKYVQSRTHASFSHGICPDCLQAHVEDTAQLAER